MDAVVNIEQKISDQYRDYKDAAQREKEAYERKQCSEGYLDYSSCCSYYGIKCYSSSSSSYFGDSPSSSSNQSKSYLESSKSMKVCLTYFETESNWDVLGPGDPEISFTIYAITSTGQSTTIYTGMLLDEDNTKFWSGNSCTTKTIPALTQTIKVCPEVVDEDLTNSGTDNHSSGYCYSISDIGYLIDGDVQEQSDYRNSDCDVEWEWYLY